MRTDRPVHPTTPRPRTRRNPPGTGLSPDADTPVKTPQAAYADANYLTYLPGMIAGAAQTPPDRGRPLRITEVHPIPRSNLSAPDRIRDHTCSATTYLDQEHTHSRRNSFSAVVNTLRIPPSTMGAIAAVHRSAKSGAATSKCAVQRIQAPSSVSLNSRQPSWVRIGG
ncbi:hypothetical protein NRB20_22700 [Nocardia sp. RB20]|uniref:Uncharacterized protein n=1 Tax=Nocardia macrotermitis TaxID=2585198 RepID=A0A7K0D0D0_9NOCA|nr:hypothetical protein [Nocardia macrotermitis]